MIAELDRTYFLTRPKKSYTRLVSHLMFQGRPLTTRFRGLNGVNQRVLALLQDLDGSLPVEKNIYIVGLGRSGTTILGKILSLHPAIGWLNEPKLLWHMAYPHEDVIGSYTSGEARYILNAEDASPEVAEKIRSLYAVYLRLSASERVLDKYPEMVFRIAFLERLFTNNRYICLARDGRDAMQSIQTWSEAHEAVRSQQIENWWGKDRRKWELLVEQVVPQDPALCEIQDQIRLINDPYDMAAVEWITAMDAAIQSARLLPDKFLLIHYEQLLAEPEAVLSRVFAFCDLKHDTKCIEYATQTLRPAAAKKAIEPSPLIQPAFDRTMRLLGYE